MDESTQAFLRYKERRQAEAEAANYSWSAAEVSDLEAAAAVDNAAAIELGKLRPFIEQSHRRGEWKRPHEMDRAAAGEFLQSRGVVGEPWSTLEIRLVMQDDELREKYADDLKEIQSSGLLITGPQDQMLRGAAWGFGGETPEVAEKHLRRKLAALDKRRFAAESITKALDELSTNPEARLGRPATVTYLRGVLDKVWAHGNSKEFPVNTVPGYETLLGEYQSRGGTL